eukprot:6200479-Pleurochrysis_carterae.AAC.1
MGGSFRRRQHSNLPRHLKEIKCESQARLSCVRVLAQIRKTCWKPRESNFCEHSLIVRRGSRGTAST